LPGGAGASPHDEKHSASTAGVRADDIQTLARHCWSPSGARRYRLGFLVVVTPWHGAAASPLERELRFKDERINESKDEIDGSASYSGTWRSTESDEYPPPGVCRPRTGQAVARLMHRRHRDPHGGWWLGSHAAV